jgi:hypothetical protein
MQKLLTELLFVWVQVMAEVWLSLLPPFQEIKTIIEQQCSSQIGDVP